MWYHIWYMVKTTVYLDPDVALAFRRMSEAEGRSQAELIRDALKTYAERAKRPLPSGLGKYDSGETDVSERAKEILAAAAKRGRWR
jgi:predicted transcriptional regulator